MTEITRRKLLRGGVVCCLTAVSAGCLDATGDDANPETTDTADRTTTPPETGWMEIQNVTDTTVVASLTVSDISTDDTVFDKEASLDPSGHAGFEEVFPEYGQYEVTVRTGESRSKSQTVTYESNGWTGWSVVVRSSKIEMVGVVP